MKTPDIFVPVTLLWLKCVSQPCKILFALHPCHRDTWKKGVKLYDGEEKKPSWEKTTHTSPFSWSLPNKRLHQQLYQSLNWHCQGFGDFIFTKDLTLWHSTAVRIARVTGKRATEEEIAFTGSKVWKTDIQTVVHWAYTNWNWKNKTARSS